MTYDNDCLMRSSFSSSLEDGWRLVLILVDIATRSSEQPLYPRLCPRKDPSNFLRSNIVSTLARDEFPNFCCFDDGVRGVFLRTDTHPLRFLLSFCQHQRRHHPHHLRQLRRLGLAARQRRFSLG